MTTLHDLTTNPMPYIQQLGAGYADLYTALDTHPCDSCGEAVAGSPYSEKPIGFTHDGGVLFEPYWLCPGCARECERNAVAGVDL